MMSQATRLKVGIVGGTGYTGVELLRLLSNHPHAEVVAITSRSEDGVAVADMFPSLRGLMDLRFSVPDVKFLAQCDVVLIATRHNVARGMLLELLAEIVRVVDLSADLRSRDVGLSEHSYHETHACQSLLDAAVHGLPEINRERLRNARLVA